MMLCKIKHAKILYDAFSTNAFALFCFCKIFTSFKTDRNDGLLYIMFYFKIK